MRKQFEPYLHKFVIVDGVFSGNGYRKKDGRNDIQWKDLETGLQTPIRKFPLGAAVPEGFFEDDYEYQDLYTSFINCVTMNGETVGDGHLWLVENIALKGYKYGDKIKISGQVEEYKKDNGSIDYCIDRPEIELSK